MKKNLTLAACSVALMLITTSANAGSVSGSAELSITLVDGCTINVYSYGHNDQPAGNNIMDISMAGVEVNCAEGTSYMLGVNGGLHYDGYDLQLYDGNSGYIPYSLKINSTTFGDGGLNAVDSSYIETNSGHSAISTTAGSSSTWYEIYGDILSDYAAAGTYTDTVTFTVVWP